MFTDLSTMADYRVEWFWLDNEIILFFSKSRYNVNGLRFAIFILHWMNTDKNKSKNRSK